MFTRMVYIAAVLSNLFLYGCSEKDSSSKSELNKFTTDNQFSASEDRNRVFGNDEVACFNFEKKSYNELVSWSLYDKDHVDLVVKESKVKIHLTHGTSTQPKDKESMIATCWSSESVPDFPDYKFLYPNCSLSLFVDLQSLDPSTGRGCFYCGEENNPPASFYE